MLQKLHSLFFHELQIITALFAILISGEAQGSSPMCGISLVFRIFHFRLFYFCYSLYFPSTKSSLSDFEML